MKGKREMGFCRKLRQWASLPVDAISNPSLTSAKTWTFLTLYYLNKRKFLPVEEMDVWGKEYYEVSRTFNSRFFLEPSRYLIKYGRPHVGENYFWDWCQAKISPRTNNVSRAWKIIKSVSKSNQKYGFFMTCETMLTDSGFFEIICWTQWCRPSLMSHVMKTPVA